MALVGESSWWRVLLRGIVLSAFLFCVCWADDAKVNFSNVDPRRDITGTIMDCHDGNILQLEHGGSYYMYCMAYGSCIEQKTGCADAHIGKCGFRLDHNVSLYVSSTMQSGTWRYMGNALAVENRPQGIYYRPKIVHNPHTDLFVLWVNWLYHGDFAQSQYLVATASRPEGPFVVQNENVSTLYSVGGDFDVFLDSHNNYTGYIIYTTLAHGHSISVEQLSSDLLSSRAISDPSLSSGFFGQSFSEAPALFEHGGMYYALFGRCCCFCKVGSNIDVHVSSHPLGPYLYRGDVGSAAGEYVTQAQQNAVFPVLLADGNTTWLWTGDRWQSAPDHIKAHDFQYWTPLEFDLIDIKQLHWRDSFELDIF